MMHDLLTSAATQLRTNPPKFAWKVCATWSAAVAAPLLRMSSSGPSGVASAMDFPSSAAQKSSKLHLGDLYAESGQTFQGSFSAGWLAGNSAVSKPNYASNLLILQILQGYAFALAPTR